MRLGFAVQIILAVGIAIPVASAEAPKSEFLGSFAFHIDADWFGGFSGVSITDHGRKAMLLTDRAVILNARILRDGDNIDGVESLGVQHLLSSKGRNLIGKTRDSEGLAIGPDGSIYISFERVHRVARYKDLTKPPKTLNRPTAFRQMPENGSLEALAVDEKGQVYTLPEDVVDSDDMIPVYRWSGKRWTVPFHIPSRGSFLPVGADFGPDGRFYLLERGVSALGFRSRLRRWDIADDGAINEETLLLTDPGTHDNLEGVSMWRDDIGRLRATMISDDNFRWFQRTELVEYAFTE